MPLGLSMKVFLEMFNLAGQAQTEYGQHHQMSQSMRQKTWRKPAEHEHSFLLWGFE